MSTLEKRTIDGKTTYFDRGSGRPVVLLHGFPLSKAMWQPQIETLDQWARVLVPDLPGFGGSGGFEGPPSMDAMADRVLRFLDSLKITEPVVLGGISMGGYVTMAFARRYPQRLCGLVLVDTKADPDDEAGKANRDRMIELVAQSGSKVVIEQMLPKLVGADTLARNPRVADELHSIGSEQSASGVADALRAMRDRPDSTPGLAAVQVPTLIVVGEQDALIPPARSEELRRAIRGAKLVTISAAGHMPNMEQPEAFNAELRSFLEELGSTAL
jgi:pimeloyl-ACP methyl ester carboxylesterase